MTVDWRDSPIEAYLDELMVRPFRGGPRQLRHLVAEAEVHLRDDAAAAVAAGADPYDAEVDAVRRFGEARSVVAAEERVRPASPAALTRQVVGSGLLLGGIGALAVGVSGVLAWVVAALGGPRMLVDAAPGQVLLASDCTRWLAGDPGATSCHDAAVSDWVSEVVGYRLAMGVLGLLALLVFGWVRRRWVARGVRAVLPAIVNDAIAVVAFAAAGAWTAGMAVDYAVGGGHGWGQWAAAAPVAVGAAAYFGVRLLSELRRDGSPAVVGERLL